MSLAIATSNSLLVQRAGKAGYRDGNEMQEDDACNPPAWVRETAESEHAYREAWARGLRHFWLGYMLDMAQENDWL